MILPQNGDPGKTPSLYPGKTPLPGAPAPLELPRSYYYSAVPTVTHINFIGHGRAVAARSYYSTDA